MPSVDAIPLSSFVRDLVGPSYRDLRPLKDETTDDFPVYPELAQLLAGAAAEKQPVAKIAHTLAVTAGYAYSDAGTLAMMMTRLGLERAYCREIARSVDAMFIRSTAFLVQSADGRVVILCYRGTPPLDLISWLLDADVALPDLPPAPAPLAPGEIPVPRGSAEGWHPGFYRNVRATRPEVIRALDRAVNGTSILEGEVERSFTHAAAGSTRRASGPGPLEALYITGHSLGGAMAAVMTAMLLDTPAYGHIAAKIRGVYTFGQPMVAGQDRAPMVDGLLSERGVPMVRYVYRDDPVPCLPPSYTGTYRHFGQERHFVTSWPDRPSPTTVQSPPYRLDLATSFVAAAVRKIAPLRKVPFTKDLEDHFPLGYITSLNPGRPSEFGD